jgi:hypothetical protein
LRRLASPVRRPVALQVPRPLHVGDHRSQAPELQ